MGFQLIQVMCKIGSDSTSQNARTVRTGYISITACRLHFRLEMQSNRIKDLMYHRCFIIRRPPDACLLITVM